MDLKFRKYTEDQLIEAVKSSYTYAQALEKLKIKPAGGNYAVIKKYIKLLNLDISHFTLQGWSKGKTLGPKRTVEEYLSNSKGINSYKLKLRLIKEGIFQAVCSNCKLTEWLSKPIPLELEHKNGCHEDNSLENLCLLCPNCHALTPTYRAKNRKKVQQEGVEPSIL